MSDIPTPTESQEALSALVALSEKATAGPWFAEGISVSAHHVAADPRLEYWLIERTGGDNRPDVVSGRPTDNAAFIAALVNWFRANHAEIHESVYLRHLLRAANARGDGVAAIRTAVADYMRSEGCSCCENTHAHAEHKETLAKLLDVNPYDDGSGYDFSQYRTPTPGSEAQS